MSTSNKTPVQISSLSSEDKSDWHDYTRKVTPLAERYQQYVQTPNKPPPFKRRTYTASSVSADNVLFHWNNTRTSPYQEDKKRWSRHPAGRIQWRRWLNQRPEHYIDLHGETTDSAFHVLTECLHEAQRHNHRVILCIHGKGLRSPQGESVLRRALRHWLMHSPIVIAYSAAPDHRGGDGATLIWLRAPN